MPRRALITGITGQDGSYLAEHLLEHGYEVHGIVRRVALEQERHRLARIEHILDRVHLHPGSIECYPAVFQLFGRIEFDECYHLAAQSYVAESFRDPFTTFQANIDGTHHILEAMRELRLRCKLYFAGTSEMFGKVREVPQRETTPFHPRSPYGVSKVTGYYLVQNYRESYGMFCASGILFNHESPRRGTEFVTRKVSLGAARVKLGLATEVRLGNLDARRDWGHAREYVRAMRLMLQRPEPDDYVIATGETHTVRDLCEEAFAVVGLDWRDHVVVDESFYRPADVELLVGDATKARDMLCWEPRLRFADLVREMVESDLETLRAQAPARVALV
jgi:GDPmannose 4,6-dehydratase